MRAVPKRIEIKELPEGWIEVSLNAAVESMKNGLYKPANEYAEDGVACLRMYNIDGGRIIWKNIKRMLLTSDEMNEYQLAPDDLLVNRVNSRELVGKTAIFPKGLEPCVYESKNIRVRLLSELVSSDFVNYQLLLFGQHYFNYNSQQVVGMASISQPQIGDFPLLVPPRIEQDRIVSKVQAMLAKIAKSSSHIANAAKTLKRFRQAVLEAACSGRLTEDWRTLREREESVEKLKGDAATKRRQAWDCTSKHKRKHYPDPIPFDDLDLPEIPQVWTWVSADEVCSRITDGEHIQPRYKPHGFPMITAKHVRDGFVEFKEVGLISEEDFQKCLLRCSPTKDDILIVSVGATTGRAAIVDECGPFAMVRSVLMLRPVIESTFLLRWIQSPWCQRWISQASGASAQPHFYIHDTRRMPVPLAPVSEQLEIARRIDALFALADEIERRVSAATIRSDKLTQSILAKAFRGELVPTEAELARREGREYEPASVLLERIKKEREEQTSSKPKQQRRSGKAGLAAAKGRA